MPLLLSRQLSTASLAAIVEKSQRQPSQSPPPDYELQLRNNQLDLVLLSKPPPKPPVPPKPSKLPALPKGSVQSTADEGFESDIDTISLISSENETFGVEKLAAAAPLTETDSANGGSGTESETETEKTNTLTQKNVNSIKEGLERPNAPPRETFDLVDCICYADVNYPDVLVFVIKKEALVFKFANLENLQTFYTNFTTLKAVANQRAYSVGRNQAGKYNLLQRTDQNGVTHIEIKKQSPTSITSFDAAAAPRKLLDITDATNDNNKVKDVNLRQRAQSKLISDTKFNTVNNKVGQKQRIVRSSSIENILHIDSSHLVKGNDAVGSLRKVWNSAEDLLDSDSPRRPERRRKKKPAPPPPPPTQPPPKAEDVLSGQFVRVSVHVDALKDLDHARLVVKSSANEPHPKKLSQNFNLLGKSLLKTPSRPASTKESLLRPPQENATLNRPHRVSLYEKNHSWTNSVPRILKKSARSRSETRTGPQSLQPMAYRYVDTTMDYPCPASLNNALFLNTTGLRPKTDAIQHQPRLSFGYNVPGGLPKYQEHPMGNRVFGLTPKLKDFSRGETPGGGGKWGSTSDLTYLSETNNLKSSIKSGEPARKKKNDKKVTFSAYTTVQVV